MYFNGEKKTLCRSEACFCVSELTQFSVSFCFYAKVNTILLSNTLALTISNSVFCIYVIRMILNVNRDCFLYQQYFIDLCNGEAL
jgi:hypothetical protein